MTTFQASGAGQAIEDGFILASILSQPLVARATLPAALQAYDNAEYVVRPRLAAEVLSKKAQRELWKQSSEANLPLRRLPRPRPFQWGRDCHGRDLGDLPLDQYRAYCAKADRLARLRHESDRFRDRRDRARAPHGWVDWATGESTSHLERNREPTDEDIENERRRRAEIAPLVGPFIPDADLALFEPADVGVAAQEPQQLDDNRAQVQFLGRQQRKSLGEIEPQLGAEQR